MYGFKKSDVNVYIESLVRDFEVKIRQKETEIEILKSKLTELEAKSDMNAGDKAKIADVLIQARADADRIREEARISAENERKVLEEKVEIERQNLIRIKERVREFRLGISALLNEFDSKLVVKTEGIDNDRITENRQDTPN